MKRNARLHNVVLAGRVAIGLTLPALVHSVLLLIVLLITAGNGAAVEADPRRNGQGRANARELFPLCEPELPGPGPSGALPTSTPPSPPTLD